MSQKFVSTEAVEQLVDGASAAAVMDAFATVMFEKAAHLESAWGDREGAKLYERMGKQADKFRRTLNLNRL